MYELLAEAYLAKDDKAAAIAELERYAEDRRARPRHAQAAGQACWKKLASKKEAAAALDRLNYIYPMDDELHQPLGDLWLDLGNVKGAIREFGAVLATKPLDPAAAALRSGQRLSARPTKTDKAKDELLPRWKRRRASGRPRRLLLELSTTEDKNRKK